MRTCLVSAALLVNVVGFGCQPDPSDTLAPQAEPPIDLLADPAGELVEETWAAHEIRGIKIGHRHHRVFRVNRKSEPLLLIVDVDHLELRRFDSIAIQELMTASLESEAGEVRQLAYRVANGDSVTEARGTVTDGQLRLERTGALANDIRQWDWPADQGGFFAIERSLGEQPMTDGERRMVRAFVPLVDRPVQFELTAMGPVEIAGQPFELQTIRAVDPRAAGWKIPSTYWTNPTGQIVKSQDAFLDRETTVVDQLTATRPNETFRLDLGVDIGVPVEPPINHPSSVVYAVYRVRIDGMSPRDVFPVGLSQRVLPAEDGVALITVSQVTPDDPSSLEMRPSPPGPDDLANNALIQSEHPTIKRIAEVVAGNIDDPWFAAQLLEGHVHRRLDEVDYSQVFSNAADVAERRQGDCSEHAVLLAALCRAHGIPARVAVGLVYAPQNQRFLYHMWNEVWIRDRWVPLDATLGQGAIGGCHIKLRDSNLAGQTAYEMVSPVIHLIGRTHIDVVSTNTTMPQAD